MKIHFSSERERRLWFMAILLVVGVFSTLGVAQTVAAELRARGILGTSLIVAAVGIVVVLGLPWIRKRPGLGEIGAAIAVLLVYLIIWPRVVTPEERTHLIEYSLLFVLIHQALTERSSGQGLSWTSWVIAWLATVGIGITDELVQAVIPGRRFDPIDIVFNTFAATLGTGARGLLLGAAWWHRKRREASLH